ncbi:hypothetical protein WJX81_004278 [Elliptochloris bilobata]|uniref:LisH domain-containing protein n=1 Tax=Elliptochloris bilobata TaxID=381761 RepID=A0AAW1QIE0_9CHLO
MDPDALALLVVQQYLSENSFDGALELLEKQSGLFYVGSKLAEGSVLMQMVYKKQEEEAAAACSEGDADREARLAAEEALLHGTADYPVTRAGCLEDRHEAAITAVLAWPGRDALLTGQGNGVVQLLLYERPDDTTGWTTRLGGGGVLSLALHEGDSPGRARLLAASMDGGVALLDARTGELLASVRAHTRYCVRVRWLPGGAGFLSAGREGALACWACAPGGEAGAGAEAVQQTAAEPYAMAVQDVELLAGGGTAVVALRDTCRLRLYGVREAAEVGQVNLNPMGDEHVGFVATQLALSPDGTMLAVSTDGPRILVLRVAGWEQVRNICGLTVEPFHQATALWHSSGYHLMAAAAAGQVFVFHVGSGKVVAKVKAQPQKNVRAMDYDTGRNLLVTAGFDRTVNVFMQHSAAVKFI